jgi:Fe-S protein assembly co-chaperone HscB
MKTNYYELLLGKGKIEFNIDMNRLKNKYIKLQSIFHPDGTQDTDRKGEMQLASSYINDAYQTMKSPVLRAKYIIDHFLPSPIGYNEDVIESTPDLEDIFELHEDLENSTTKSETISKIKVKQEKALLEISNSIESRNVQKTLRLLHLLRYLETLEDQVISRIE